MHTLTARRSSGHMFRSTSPADHPGQRALAQMHRTGDLLDLRGLVGELGESLEHLVLAHAQAVAGLQLTVERTGEICVPRQDLAPLADIGADFTSPSADLRVGHSEGRYHASAFNANAFNA
jgi:hypothetical protein